ncbi:hypothetical protein FA95DRAFT_1609551 [Auriscalpium vulgare]|uniref:Uncharacterized protein n=1 Tax=Auriscalpium vulgare TaxID=40419 RepID=A0ACB8RGL3_9AGAM|nr:hypothetical protein FA95DRAFT_1609551 [Auriscalpium vulgare]
MSVHARSMSTLTHDSPCNTALHSAAGAALYTVSTAAGDTRVHAADGQRVAEWEWQRGVLTLGARPLAPARAWLKRSRVPFRGTATFTDDLGAAPYKWTNNRPGKSLQLYGPQAKADSAPIARFVPASTIPARSCSTYGHGHGRARHGRRVVSAAGATAQGGRGGEQRGGEGRGDVELMTSDGACGV